MRCLLLALAFVFLGGCGRQDTGQITTAEDIKEVLAPNFEAIDKRFSAIDKRLDGVEGGLSEHKSEYQRDRKEIMNRLGDDDQPPRKYHRDHSPRDPSPITGIARYAEDLGRRKQSIREELLEFQEAIQKIADQASAICEQPRDPQDKEKERKYEEEMQRMRAEMEAMRQQLQEAEKRAEASQQTSATLQQKFLAANLALAKAERMFQDRYVERGRERVRENVVHGYQGYYWGRPTHPVGYTRTYDYDHDYAVRMAYRRRQPPAGPF